jgi:AcrR family transcriptional regulator
MLIIKKQLSHLCNLMKLIILIIYPAVNLYGASDTIEVICDMYDFVQVNPIAERSKKWLCDAMIALLYEKPYSSISITELCEKAGLVRKTFYRHFQSKDAVIKATIDIMFEQFMENIRSRNIEDAQLSLTYFQYWEQHKRFLELLIDNQLFYLLNDQYVLYLKVMEDLIGVKMQGESEVAKEYMMSILAGGLWTVLRKWILRDCQESPEEMARIVNSLLISESND